MCECVHVCVWVCLMAASVRLLEPSVLHWLLLGDEGQTSGLTSASCSPSPSILLQITLHFSLNSTPQSLFIWSACQDSWGLSKYRNLDADVDISEVSPCLMIVQYKWQMTNTCLLQLSQCPPFIGFNMENSSNCYSYCLINIFDFQIQILNMSSNSRILQMTN